jgi:hypothetical protein
MNSAYHGAWTLVVEKSDDVQCRTHDRTTIRRAASYSVSINC